MVSYRRRFYGRRRRTARRPLYRRRRPALRRRRTVYRRRHSVHLFTRWTDVNSLNVTDATQQGAMTFYLNQLPSASEFTALFDQYRINCVVLKMRYLNQIPDRTDASSGAYRPNFHYCVDYNDSTAYTSITQFAQVGNYRCHALNGERDWSIKIFPKVQRQMYQGLGSTGYGPVKCWINTADPAVPHYGLKYLIDCNGGGGGNEVLGSLQYQAKYYLSFKNVK